MTTLTCRNHTNLFWSYKNIDVNEHNNRYNGQHHLYFNGKPSKLECSCDTMYLVDTEQYNTESDDERIAEIHRLNSILENSHSKLLGDNHDYASHWFTNPPTTHL